MFETIPVPAFQDNYIWLIINPARKTVAIVDPGDAAPVINKIAALGLTPVALLITHHHGDHVGGIPQLLQHWQLPVYGPANETIPGRTHSVHGGEFVTLDKLDARFQVLEVPGHTSGHIAYHGHNMLFIGDTVFMAGCGRLFEGTAAQMHESLARVAALADSTRIYCAHEYTLANLRFAQTVEPENPDIKYRMQECTMLRKQNLPTVPATLAIERKTNPFLRTHTPAVISAAELFAGQSLPDATAVFANIRKWKDNF